MKTLSNVKKQIFEYFAKISNLFGLFGVIQITLHEPHEVPLVTELAYGVSPGFEVSLAMSKSAVSVCMYLTVR